MTRREEKRLCSLLASAAAEVSKSGLNHAELYFARVLLAQRIRELLEADVKVRG